MLMLVSSLSFANDDGGSVFYTKDEEESLINPSVHTSTIKLEGILFVKPSHWMVWINGKQISHGDETGIDGVKIVHVGSDEISINVHGKEVKLKPGDDYTVRRQAHRASITSGNDENDDY